MAVIPICTQWVEIWKHICSYMYGFTFGSRFCASASLQLNCAGICSVMLLTFFFNLFNLFFNFNLFFLWFLLSRKPHFIHLISLFISLITLWYHLLGTDSERETPSCLSSCTIWSCQFRVSGRGLQRSVRLLRCAGSRVAAASLTTELFLFLPSFCCVSSHGTVLSSHFFPCCTEYLHSTIYIYIYIYI